MALTINTNLGSLIVQKNLTDATKALNKSIERMTTGFRINSAADDAAGYAVATKMSTKLSSISVAQDNVAIGTSMLSTAEKNCDLVTTHLQRIRDLIEEKNNGTYDTDSISAINTEIESRAEEIKRIINVSEFNGISVLKGGNKNIQVGYAADDKIEVTLPDLSALAASTSPITDSSTLDDIDGYLKSVTTAVTGLGASINRLDSAADALDVQYSNLTSSLSTVRDADIAKESSAYITAQILQQASASLLATANQAPSIALNLI